MAIEIASTIRASAGDYSSVSEWVLAHDDGSFVGGLPLSSVSGYSYTGANGIQPNEIVTNASGAQGKVIGQVRNSKIAIFRVSGTFANGDVITSPSGTVTLTSPSDFVHLVGELYGDWPNGLDDQIDITIRGNQNTFAWLRVVNEARHKGRPLSSSGLFYLAPSSGDGFIRRDNTCRLDDIAIYAVNGVGFNVGRGVTLVNPAIYFAGGASGYDNIGQNSRLINAVNYATTGVGFQLLSGDTGQRLFNCSDWNSQSSFGVTTLLGTSQALLINCAGLSNEPGIPSFIGTFTNSSNSNNASFDTSAPGSNAVYNATPELINETTHLKHIAATDTALNNRGLNLTSNGYFDFDFDYDYDIRPATDAWAIGADQPVSSGAVIGIGGGILPSIEGQGEGVLLNQGFGVGTLSLSVVGNGEGYVDTNIGNGALLLPVIEGYGTAHVEGDGQGFGILPIIRGFGAGITAIEGAGAGALPAFIGGYIAGYGHVTIRLRIEGFGAGKIDGADLTEPGFFGLISYRGAFEDKRHIPTPPLIPDNTLPADSAGENVTTNHPHQIFTQRQADWLQREIDEVKKNKDK